MAESYVVQDRTLATKWKRTFTNGEPAWTATSDAAQPEPVLLDLDDDVTHWKLFMDNGEQALEVTVDALIPVVLDDTAMNLVYELFVEFQTLAWTTDQAEEEGAGFLILLRRRRCF